MWLTDKRMYSWQDKLFVPRSYTWLGIIWLYSEINRYPASWALTSCSLLLRSATCSWESLSDFSKWDLSKIYTNWQQNIASLTFYQNICIQSELFFEWSGSISDDFLDWLTAVHCNHSEPSELRRAQWRGE